MILTDEQRQAVLYDGHAVVVACPGSGKTRAIAAKLLRAVAAVQGTPRRVACITYTNAAVGEIEGRTARYGRSADEDNFEVSTIHSFCQNNVLRHFHWRIPAYKKGYTVLPSDSDEYAELVEEIGNAYGLDSYAQSQMEQINRKPDGTPLTPSGIPPKAALEFWGNLERRGYIDFCNIVYYSYRILRDDVSLVRNVASTFACILVDEFQDTSALQVEILALIEKEGLTELFLVGDPEQSIYSFAGAERDLMFSFANAIGAKTFSLSGNFRSSPPVIDCAERLIARKPRMFAAGTAAAYTESPIHRHVDNIFTGITEEFLPVIEGLGIPFGQVAVLANSWFQLMPLGRQLRNYGIPVVGPGARPYRKKHLFVGIAENICAYVETPEMQLIRATEKELFFAIQNITGRADFRVFDLDGRRTVFRLLDCGQKLKESHHGAMAWLGAAAAEFSAILVEDGFLPTASQGLLQESAQAMIRDMESHDDVDVANLVLTDLGMFASPEKNVKLLTMHGAKGREFEAVAVIGLHDGRIPYHNKYNVLTKAAEEEAKRLLYVSLTRAKRMLLLLTDNEDWRPRCRFLASLGFE